MSCTRWGGRDKQRYRSQRQSDVAREKRIHLEQLEGLEKQRNRSRKARRRLKQDDSGEDSDPDLNYPLIETDDKSRERVKNRFKGIKNPKDAIDEFGS